MLCVDVEDGLSVEGKKFTEPHLWTGYRKQGKTRRRASFLLREEQARMEDGVEWCGGRGVAHHHLRPNLSTNTPAS